MSTINISQSSIFTTTLIINFIVFSILTCTANQQCAYHAQDSFDYSSNNSLNGQNGGDGFSTVWQVTPMNGSIDVLPGSLTFNGHASNGNKIRITTQNEDASKGATRNLSTPITNGETFWLSCLIRAEVLADGGFWIRPNGRQDIAIGKRWGSNLSIDNNSTNTSIQQGEVHKLVAQYQLQSNQTIVHLWVNRNENFTTANADATKTIGSLTDISSLSFSIERWGDGVAEIDEITLSCSPPDLPPASCTTGDVCNDADACTTGDVYDANCNCNGTFVDSDNDGICDANDVCTFCANPQVYINEVGANNETTVADLQVEFDDWIEIYNSADTPNNLAGYYITDDINDPVKWEIPSTDAAKTTVPANGYLLFWADEQIADGADHVNFSLNSDGETVYLFATDGLTLIDSLNYPSLSNDVSFGRSTDGNTTFQYFSDPTPLATNANSIDVVILFSEPSQAFMGSLSVTLATTVNNGVLRYTTNGTEPTASSPVYNGAISITSNTVLKAKYFFNNGIVSNTVSERYVKMANDMNNISSDLPIILIDTYGQNINPDEKLNTFCSVIEPDATSRAYADGLATFAGKMGMKIRGASSSSSPKKQWSIEFRNEDDSDKAVKVGNMPAEADWRLYAPGFHDRGLINNALMYELGRRLGYWSPRTQFVEVYYNDNGGDLSSADYWGVYILTEKIEPGKDRLDIAKLKPTDNTGEDLTGGYLFSIDWHVDFTTDYTYNHYNSPWVGYEMRTPRFGDLTTDQFNYLEGKIVEFETALTSPNWLDPQTGYKNFTDIDTWAHAHLLRALAKEPDGFAISHYMYKDKNGLINAGPLWDFDRAINSVDTRSESTTGWDVVYAPDDPTWDLHQPGWNGNTYYWKDDSRAGIFIRQMIHDPDYETLMYDKWVDWRRNKALQTPILNGIIDSMANVLSESQVRNYNRWKGENYDPRYGGFWGEIDAMKTWFKDRSEWIDSQMIPNPAVSPQGGTVTVNQNISINNTYGSGTIYYTIDGSDPRMSGGAINSTALTYNGSFNITEPGISYVTTRIKTGNTWGAICQLAFYVDDNYSDVVINEIHYNPMDVDTLDGDNFEFIELKNKSADPVNLTGLKFTNGVEYTFPAGSVLPANGFVVLADDSLEFINQYGFSPMGNYGKNLSNAGEHIILSNYYGNMVDEVIYDDSNPWRIEADGTGPSLGLIDATSDNQQAANWGIQITPVTPNAENDFCNGSLSFSAQVIDISCNGVNDGFITGNGLGGNAPYTYQWSNGSNGSTITSLAPGMYTLTLTDAFGCPYVESFEITEPAALTGNITSTNESYYQTNDGTAVVNMVGGISPYSYNWSNGTTTSSINNLSPGNYSVDVLDATGCPFTTSITINALVCNPLQVDVDIQHETCTGEEDGLLQIANIQNGTSPYDILWSTGITGNVINNLNSGIYQLNVTDNVGCSFDESYTINSASNLSHNTIITNVSSNSAGNGSIDLSVNGGTPPYSYFWSTAATTEDVNGLTLGSYWVSITDANDCQLLVGNIEIESNCIVSIIHLNHPVLVTDVYQVGSYIQSNAMININEQVDFKAGDYIELTNDFEVTQGAGFEAIIDGCE